MNIDVNYKNKKRYNTAKYPIRQPKIIVWLIWLLSRFALFGKSGRWRRSIWRASSPPICC